MNRLLIFGGGGHGRSVAEAVIAAGRYRLVGFVDDAVPAPACIRDWPVLGSTADLGRCRDLADAAIVAIGNNDVRKKLHESLHAAGFELAIVIHPAATVSPSALMGAGSAIMAGAIVGTEARLGEGVIVNCGAVVDHDCQVGDFGHLSVNASMAGGAILGRRAWMQAGAVLGYGAQLAAGSVLAPGQAVMKERA
ncbi:NeuD/PglB/VioB family sugar acetyltransferase [Cupriavidus metallidurans]|uniref:NeuD/PglB/VioB family sugar acetyltransferase n=1 Tax=Cupriavidus metallidurans TaxID=119219 RepID=UPI003D756BC4